MAFAIAASHATRTNVELIKALRAHGQDASVASVRRLRNLAAGDVVLGRVDVLPSLDGVQSCLWGLRELERTGVRVLNHAGALLACHDKLLTALRLGRYGIPHPKTAHADNITPPLHMRFPVVVKPRFGSWGRDVVLCENEKELAAHFRRLRRRRWFRRQGALIQELVPPRGHDLRVVVARGAVVGAIARVSPPGEWRTNVALGATRQPVAEITPDARTLAVASARALRADLVAVDLLPEGDGYVVLELNGAADFTRDYSLQRGDIFSDVARLLVGDPDSGSVPVDEAARTGALAIARSR
jgi:RimK family alpha-L-glutamate ligase